MAHEGFKLREESQPDAEKSDKTYRFRSVASLMKSPVFVYFIPRDMLNGRVRLFFDDCLGAVGERKIVVIGLVHDGEAGRKGERGTCWLARLLPTALAARSADNPSARHRPGGSRWIVPLRLIQCAAHSSRSHKAKMMTPVHGAIASPCREIPSTTSVSPIGGVWALDPDRPRCPCFVVVTGDRLAAKIVVLSDGSAETGQHPQFPP